MFICILFKVRINSCAVSNFYTSTAFCLDFNWTINSMYINFSNAYLSCPSFQLKIIFLFLIVLYAIIPVLLFIPIYLLVSICSLLIILCKFPYKPYVSLIYMPNFYTYCITLLSMSFEPSDFSNFSKPMHTMYCLSNFYPLSHLIFSMLKSHADTTFQCWFLFHQ